MEIKIEGINIVLDISNYKVCIENATLVNFIYNWFSLNEYKDLLYKDLKNDKYIVFYIDQKSQELSYTIFYDISLNPYEKSYLDLHCDSLENIICMWRQANE